MSMSKLAKFLSGFFIGAASLAVLTGVVYIMTFHHVIAIISIVLLFCIGVGVIAMNEID